jgi:hypothetical protein
MSLLATATRAVVTSRLTQPPIAVLLAGPMTLQIQGLAGPMTLQKALVMSPSRVAPSCCEGVAP